MDHSSDTHRAAEPLAGTEIDEGLFSVLCPRFGTPAELRVDVVSGAVRRFSCSIHSPDDRERRRCQAACARWVLSQG